MSAFGKNMILFGIIVTLVWFGFNILRENWPTPSPEETLVAAQKARDVEFARQQKIRQQTLTTRVIPLNPGQVITVDVGDRYDFKTYNGEFRYSLLYQGHVIASGFHTPEKNNDYLGDMPVDQIEFSQHPRYPYGQLTITLVSNQR